MIIVNFAHPISQQQVAEIKLKTGLQVDRILDIPSQIDINLDLEPQIMEMIKSVPLTSNEWQTEALLINMPALQTSASVLLAMLHGIMGHFPAILCLRPVDHSMPRRFELSEVLNLQDLRDEARQRR